MQDLNLCFARVFRSFAACLQLAVMKLAPLQRGWLAVAHASALTLFPVVLSRVTAALIPTRKHSTRLLPAAAMEIDPFADDAAEMEE